MNLAIVVVTRNRLKMLENCLKSLEKQGQRHIYIVNNASTDGTDKFLAGLPSTEITVLTQKENLGGAGGFAIGINAAFKAGHDWIWVMDDDVQALPGALKMLAKTGESAGPCCIVPAKYYADGTVFDYEYRISRKTLRRKKISSLGNLPEKALIKANSGNFEGMFLHRNVVEKIGLPEKDFFICWDDAFYGMRAAEYFPNYYLNEFALKKQFDKEKFYFGKKKFLGSTLFSRFYFLRNYLSVLRYLKNKKELSGIAYGVFLWEWLKAALITILIEGNPRGLIKLSSVLRKKSDKN